MSLEKIHASGPRSVGVIMDENRRFAEQKNVSTIEGHEAGYRKLKEVVRWAPTRGIETLYAFAFSEANWHRSSVEISALLALLKRAIAQELDQLTENKARLRIIGTRDRLAQSMQDLMCAAEEKTKNNTGLNLVIAFSYSGRADVAQSVKHLIQNGTVASGVDDARISQGLWTRDLPDPQLIIRSGGGRNLSDFLTWQAADADIEFLDTLWPDVSLANLDEALLGYATRPHRNGR